MKKILALFSLLTVWSFAVANPLDIMRYSRVAQNETEEVAFQVTHSEVQGSGKYANLVLYGEHDTYGKISVYLDSYNGEYKTYTIYYAMIGSVEVSGEGTWSKNGHIETLEASLATRDGSRRFHLVATNTLDQTVTLNFSGFSTFGYDSKYGDWFMRIEGLDPTRPEYGYKVELAYYAPQYNGFGTFTSANNQINMADSYIHTPTGDVVLDSVTLTVERKKVSDNLQQTIANARLVGRNGITYLVNCIHNSITPKTQYVTTINDADLYRTAHSFTFSGQNSEYEATIRINSSVLVGKHAMKTIELDKSEFYHNGIQLDVLSIQAEVKSNSYDDKLACTAQVALLTRDTIMYVFQLHHVFPAPVDTIDVTCTNLLVNDAFAEQLNMVTIDAKNDQYILSGGWVATQATPGTYQYPDVAIQLVDVATGQQVQALDAMFRAQIEASAHWSIEGFVRGEDNKLYLLHLSYVIPTPTDTVIVRFDHAAKATFSPDMDNDLLFENMDEHFYASLNIRGIPMNSTFTLHNVDREYCGVHDSITGTTTELADVNGSIFQTGDTTIMHAELISMDAVLYDIELWYIVPTPIDTIEMSFPVEFGDLRSEQGFYQLFGPSPDTTYAVAFSPMSEEIEGVFINDGMFGRFGAEGGLMQLDHRNTYIATIEDDIVTNIMSIEKGQLTVNMDADGNIVALAEVICADSIFYRITMTSKYERIYLRGDKQSGEVERIYTASDQIVVQDFSEQGYVYMAVAAADQSDLMAMHFFVDSIDSDITIPEGTYTINKSYRPGTVLASMGPSEDNQLSTPFYATLSSDGYLSDVYMWVKGTVTVTKNADNQLYVEVKALNSYDVPVHIIYDASRTPVENVLDPSPSVAGRKFIRDGHLFILRDSKTYTPLGTVVR